MPDNIQPVETYRGWKICIVPIQDPYYLVVQEGSWDYEQIPFKSTHQARCHIDDIISGTALTAEEADQVYDESPAEPITRDEIEVMVRRVTGKV